MNSVHDLGGVDGFGPIPYVREEPVFIENWEEKVFAMYMVLLGQDCYNLDEFRYHIEHMEPVYYLDSSYYEHWLLAMEVLMVEKGYINREEYLEKIAALERSETAGALERLDQDLTRRSVDLIYRGNSTYQQDYAEMRHCPGDKVKVKNMHPKGHTRVPRYVRDKIGTVDRYFGTFVLPDSNTTHGVAPKRSGVYLVAFEAQDLWGEEAPAQDTLYIELWEDYFEKI
ncbi:nitrile hydratase subunit beta [Paenibacillus sp. FSL H7-0326]|uniref:nitrile hydratase subunit beta n=1 Tax=Paenibacillus sp. FSL H7-0326 TaxID=1921144 RepID=UPI00096E3FB3|nr:nitrile hydratase subunit beta [Paenibacillus sp. FSL H7-0326]OMC71414.1 nitrile hydratase subunit beta [Paenibacillus sp. FSL H7-0326]